MTNILTWRPEWTLEIDVLDRDHRQLIDLLSDIARRFGPDGAPLSEPSAAGEDSGGGDLLSFLERLGTEARAHFSREEEFMRSIEYPRLATHHKEHAVLTAEYMEIVRHFREQAATSLQPEDIASLKHWLIAHVLGQDRGFADHYFQLLRDKGD